VRRLLALAAVVVCACPAPTPTPDASVVIVDDAGFDAGVEDVDAGRLRYDAGTVDAGFTVATATSWCRSRALAACLRQVRCLSVSESSVADCVARTVDTCDQVSFTTAVDAGRLAFDPAQGVRCLNDFATGSCALEPASCATVFRGQVAVDAGCVTAAECGAGGYCDVYTGTCPYRCRAFGAPGDVCDFVRRCGPGLGCFSSDGGFTEYCQPLKRTDEPCVSFDECGDEGACISGKCISRRADAGQPCGVRSGYPYCAEEYFCRQDPPAMEGGEPPPGTCERRAGLGGTCIGSQTCLPSLRCSTVITTGTCLARAKRGGLCGSYADCEDGLYCASLTGRCEPYPADGGDCGYSSGGSSGRCLTGFFCRYNAGDYACERRRAVGEDCEYDQVCLSNECEFGRRPDGGFGGTCGVPCSLKADAGL
jgi:hypothetical protein